MKNKKPLVSIVIPCYNHDSFVQDAIQSVVDQTYKNIELIIIDDGSKDESVIKIQEMIDVCRERFTRFEFRSRPNKGLSATLNEAIKWCDGKYYAAIASDDIILQHKTQIQVEYLEDHPEITSLSANVDIIDENNNSVGSIRRPKKEAFFKEIFLSNFLLTPPQMHRLEAVKSVGGYNENVIIEDWYMWLKLAHSGKRIMFLDDVVCLYRMHPTNTSKNTIALLKSQIQICDDFKDSSYYYYAVYKLERQIISELYKENGNRLSYRYKKLISKIKYYLFNLKNYKL